MDRLRLQATSDQLPATEPRDRGGVVDRAIIGEERRVRIKSESTGTSTLSIKPPFHVPVRAHSLERDYARTRALVSTMAIHHGHVSGRYVYTAPLRVFVHATYLLAYGFLSGHGS